MNPKLFKTEIELVEGSIYEVKALKKGYYDQQASGYDKLISNPVYNKIMWGNLPANYTEFCQQGLDDNKGDVVVDMGCGTLNFTHKVYAKNHSKQLYLCDLSLEMLRIGKKKTHAKRN